MLLIGWKCIKKGTYTSTVTCVHGYMILKEHNHDADTEEIT